MALSPHFSDSDLISNLRLQFEYDEMFDVDFRSLFNQIEEREHDYFLRFRGHKFSIDKITSAVKEVT